MATQQGNPPTRDILNNHELAHRTITQHGTELEIFDERELGALRRFVNDPSPENQRWVVEEYCGSTLDPEGTPDEEIGRNTAGSGSLVGYVVARYGRVRDDVRTFYPSEVEALRKWFESGGGGLGEDAKL